MTDPLDRLALAETPDDVAAALAAAPHLAADAARWRAVRAAVRRDLGRDLPEADLLVLRALDPTDLTPAERARLDAARRPSTRPSRAIPASPPSPTARRPTPRRFERAWADSVDVRPRTSR